MLVKADLLSQEWIYFSNKGCSLIELVLGGAAMPPPNLFECPHRKLREYHLSSQHLRFNQVTCLSSLSSQSIFLQSDPKQVAYICIPILPHASSTQEAC